MIGACEHQYVDRRSGNIVTEKLYSDRFLKWLYASPWENRAWLIKALVSSRMSSILGFLNYDWPIGTFKWGAARFSSSLGVDLSECIDSPEELDTPRKLFQRKIRFWDLRPMDDDPDTVAAPADSRILFGSFSEQSSLFLKGKFFEYEELFGLNKKEWIDAFQGGDFGVCRLTPEKYHYNHLPVTGTVKEIYSISGQYHSCNPGPVVSIVTPYSKNSRVVTILDTDVSGGSQIGLVGMIEVVALMIGAIDQCYSTMRYDSPIPVEKGMFLLKGQPKSLFRPGSSTTALVFQKGRIQFSSDLLRNLTRAGVQSRFSQGFGKSLVETDVQVRATIGKAVSSKVKGNLPGKQGEQEWNVLSGIAGGRGDVSLYNNRQERRIRND
jgi:phosphatidylserine decarboxylase